LHGEFTFRDATALLPYLARARREPRLLLAVPARAPGSKHGYDIVDHDEINPEIGTREDFEPSWPS
jgi:(1->4)-alpha-D-glucan 1-alpha-D-glucosylmutase